MVAAMNVKYVFKYYPEWNTTEDWADSDDIKVLADGINAKKLKSYSTELNPQIDLSDFKQYAEISGDTLIVTIA